MRFNLIHVSLALAGTLASAQNYSQPVREVEKEARSAVRGFCSIRIQSGRNTAEGSCSFVPPGVTQTSTTVPADKHLVVEDVSAYCTTRSGELIADLAIGFTPPSASAWFRSIPLASQGTAQTVPVATTYRAGSVSTRFYAPPGSTVHSYAFTGPALTSEGLCRVSFSGHLVNAQ